MNNDFDASGNLFNYLQEKFDLKNDAALAFKIKVAAPVISKIRHGCKIKPIFILKIHDTFDIPICEIKKLIRKE